MKYILLIIVGVSVTMTSYGQLESRNILLGGEVSLTTGENEIGFTLSPSGYYFISDNLAIGASIGFGTSRTNPGEDNYSRLNTINISPTVRYFWNLSEKAYLYGSGSIGYSNANSKIYTGDTSINNLKLSSYGISAGAGILYMLSPRFSIDLGVNIASYGRMSQTTLVGVGEEETTVRNYFRIGINTLSPSFGLYFLIK